MGTVKERRGLRAWILLVLAALFLLTPLSAIAYETDETGQGANLPDKPNTWCQTCKTNPSVYDVNTPLADGSGTTMARAACGQFSMTALLVKSTVKPVGYGPWDYNKELKARHASGKPTWSGATGWVDWSNIKDFTGGKLVFSPELSMGSTGDGANANMSNPPSKEKIAELSSKYYMIILIPGHYVAVDRVEGGEIYIIDSAGTSPTLSGITNRSNSIQGVAVFEPGPGIPDAGSSINLQTMEGASEKPEEDIIVQGSLPLESELVGMPEERDFLKDLTEAPVPDAAALGELAEGGTNGSAAQVDALLSSVDNYNQSRQTDWFRVGLSLFGLLMVFYSVLLVVAFFFDKSNPFFRFSAVSILTFGKLKAATEEASDLGASAGFLTQKGLLIRSGVALLLGILLITGSFYALLYNVYTWFQVTLLG